MSAVAARAGVTRATLYRHFPNEDALFTACSAEWRSANPSPDPGLWESISDPHDRLETALPALYGWYRSSEAMRANLQRGQHGAIKTVFDLTAGAVARP